MYRITIEYTTDKPEVNESIGNILREMLPYMVDNVDVYFDKDEI